MVAVLMVIIAIACILLLLGMAIGSLLKYRPPVQQPKESFLAREMRRMDDKAGKR